MRPAWGLGEARAQEQHAPGAKQGRSARAAMGVHKGLHKASPSTGGLSENNSQAVESGASGRRCVGVVEELLQGRGRAGDGDGDEEEEEVKGR